MVWFLVRRLLANAVVVLGAAFIVFALVFLASDPGRALLPLDAPLNAVESLRRTLGFDQPIPIQFLGFLGRAIQGNFGTSTRTLEPALGMVLEPLPATLSLGAAGVGVSLLIAVPLGIVAAVRPGSWGDVVARSLAVVGQAVPRFVPRPVPDPPLQPSRYPGQRLHPDGAGQGRWPAPGGPAPRPAQRSDPVRDLPGLRPRRDHVGSDHRRGGLQLSGDGPPGRPGRDQPGPARDSGLHVRSRADNRHGQPGPGYRLRASRSTDPAGLRWTRRGQPHAGAGSPAGLTCR